jgi:cytidylate kinase
MRADDEERRKFIHHHYRQDFDDARFYDIVVNTDRVSAERVASSILTLMNHPEAGAASCERPQEA